MPASDSLVGAALKPSPYEELRAALVAIRVAPEFVRLQDMPDALRELHEFRALQARYRDG